MKQISCHKIAIGSLSSDVLERRTSTGSERFSLLICLDANKFVLRSVLNLKKTISPRINNNIPCSSRPRFGSLFTKPCFVSYSTTLVRNV